MSAGTAVLALVVFGCGSAAPRFAHAEPKPRAVRADAPYRVATTGGDETNPAVDRHALLVAVMAKMGIPYDDGGDDSTGMDCSWFTRAVYLEASGLALPRSSVEQYETGEPVDLDELRFGDLVFFNTTGRVPSHVGVYVGDGIFAHASVSHGVTVSFLDQEYYRERFVGARRVARPARTE